MKKSTKIKLIRAVTSSKDYSDKDKLRLIRNLLDETLPSSTQLSTDPQEQTGGTISIETKEANQFLTRSEKKEEGITIEDIDNALEQHHQDQANQFLTNSNETVADVILQNKTDLLLAKLPTDIADKIQSCYDKREYNTLVDLIECGFMWDETLEGSEYWSKLVKIIHHFQSLPQPYQNQAIKNIDMKVVGNSYIDTTKQAIGDAFIWKYTEQGFDYWEELHKTL